MEDLLRTTSDKKLIYKALTGTSVNEMQKCVGDEFELEHIVQGEIFKDDETKILTCLISSDGTMYQTLSPTVNDNVKMLSTIYDLPNEKIMVRVGEGVSNNNRKFLQLELV